MFEQDVLDLEGADAIAGGLNHVVVAADVPEGAVLVLPGHIARVVPAVVDDLGRLLGVAVILHHDALGTRVHLDADLAALARVALGAVVALQLQGVEGHGLSHGAGLRLGMGKVGNRKRRFGLAEALIDGKTGRFLPEVEEVGVQGLARRGRVFERTQAIFAEILLHHQAIHGRRAAEGGDLVLVDQRQNLARVEAIEVVGEDTPLHQPLAIELAPDGLAPASVRDGEVNTVGIHVVPVLGRDQMGQRVGGVMQDHLGVARSAGGEIHKHRVVDVGLDVVEGLGRRTDARIEVLPALAGHGGGAYALGAGQCRPDRLVGQEPALLVTRGQTASGTVHEDAGLKGGALLADVFDDTGDVAHRCGDDRLDRGGVQAVGQVVLLEHEGRGDHHGTKLRQGQSHEPELVVAAQDDHHHIALADAEGGQVVGRLVRPTLHVAEGEEVLLPLRVAPDHGAAVGLGLCDVVNDVVGEIEGVGIMQLDGRQGTVGVIGLLGIAKVDVPHVCLPPLDALKRSDTAVTREHVCPGPYRPESWGTYARFVIRRSSRV